LVLKRRSRRSGRGRIVPSIGGHFREMGVIEPVGTGRERVEHALFSDPIKLRISSAPSPQ